MAKTIDHLTLMVGVSAYKHKGMMYDGLLIIVAYYKGRGFVTTYQPVKMQDYGYLTGPMPSEDPLEKATGFVVRAATKNSVKTLEQMRTNLEAAREGISFYFDRRDWQKLKELMCSAADYGYTPTIRSRVQTDIYEYNNNKSNKQNNKTMATKIMAINESENVQAAAQVTNEVESVNVGEVTLDTIMPTMTAEPVKVDEYTATTMPLGQHGTLVIAGVGGEQPKRKKGSTKFDLEKDKPETPETCNLKPETISRVRLVTYTTKRGETAPRIVGFTGEDDPRWKPINDEKVALIAAYNKAKKKDPKAKMTSSPFGPAWLTDREGTGEKTYCMTFGVRYMDVARALCEAYNTDDREAWKQAEQAVRDTKAGIVSGYQAEREAKRAERAAKKAQDVKPADVKPETKVYTEQEVAALMQRVLQGDAAALSQVNAMLAKAA